MLSAGNNIHGTGTVDPVFSSPAHEEGLITDLMEILPLLSFVMSHFEKDLSFEHLNDWRMIVYLQVDDRLRISQLEWHSIEIKIDRREGVVTPGVPINVLCSIFNEIPPIHRQDSRWSENNCHWLIRAQAWAATD